MLKGMEYIISEKYSVFEKPHPKKTGAGFIWHCTIAVRPGSCHACITCITQLAIVALKRLKQHQLYIDHISHISSNYFNCI